VKTATQRPAALPGTDEERGSPLTTERPKLAATQRVSDDRDPSDESTTTSSRSRIETDPDDDDDDDDGRNVSTTTPAYSFASTAVGRLPVRNLTSEYEDVLVKSVRGPTANGTDDDDDDNDNGGELLPANKPPNASDETNVRLKIVLTVRSSPPWTPAADYDRSSSRDRSADRVDHRRYVVRV